MLLGVNLLPLNLQTIYRLWGNHLGLGIFLHLTPYFNNISDRQFKKHGLIDTEG